MDALFYCTKYNLKFQELEFQWKSIDYNLAMKESESKIDQLIFNQLKIFICFNQRDERLLNSVKQKLRLTSQSACLINFCGDIETLFFQMKMMHAKRVFGKSIKLRKIFDKDDIVNGFNELKKNQKKKEEKLDMYN